jgi:glycosyltransferase involved in cell wall biosynthesis
MAFPPISIVTPSYNQGQFLEQTIRSVLDQNYPNLQYVIIDGGSTDGSVDIIRKYEKHLTYWVSEKDQGQSHAINKGAAKCTGEVFGYINSDDLLLPGSLESVANAWNHGHRWLAGWSKYLELGLTDWPYMVRTTQRQADWFIDNPIPQQSCFFARSFFSQFGYFREDFHYCFDYEYWLRLHFHGRLKPEVVRQCLAVFRLHKDSKTVTVWEKFEKEYAVIYREYLKYLSLKDRFQIWTGRRAAESARCRNRMWDALHAHDRKTAWKQAAAAFNWQPLSLDSLKGLYFARRGH